MGTRSAMFAGSWYPSSASACEKEIRSFLQRPADSAAETGSWLGGIVPHAGWYFSGSIACQVVRSLQAAGDADLVWVFGMHMHPGSKPVVMKEGAWETPFGDIEIDEECARDLAGLFRFQEETADDFTPDNTIELQLPFVKYFFPEARIVPVGAPPVVASLEIGRAASQITAKRGRKAKIIGSTDLTHYGPNYGFSPKGRGSGAVQWVKTDNDRRVIEAMLAMDPERVIQESLTRHNACCGGAAAAAIAAGRQMGAEKAQQVAYATSHDKSPGDSLVGYVGIVF